MLLTGIYDRGSKFSFRITTSMIQRDFMLMTLSADDLVDDEVKVYQISGKTASINKNIIISHAITNKNFNITDIYGDRDFIANFLKDLHDVNFFEGVEVFDDGADGSVFKRFNLPDGVSSITVYYRKSTEVSTKKHRLLSYEKVNDKKSRLLEMSAYAKSGRVRSLNDLKEIYDLSWIIDKSGKLIRDYRSIRTPEALEEVLTGIQNHAIISLDFETTGTEFYHYMKELPPEKQPKVVGIGISWKAGTGRYIPLISNKFECLPYEETLHTVLKALATKKLIGANHLFDFGVAYYHGYTFTCVWDVMHAEFVIDPTGSRGHKKLKEITRYYCGWETLELDEVLGGPVDGRLIPDLDEDVIMIYGCADVDTVWSVKEYQAPFIEKAKLVWKLDMSMIPLIAIEDYYGCKIDMDVWTILNEINTVDRNNVEKTIWEYLEQKVVWKSIYEMYKQQYDRELTDSEIIEVMESRPELKSISAELLMKGKGAKRGRLQLSSGKDLLYIFSEILEYPLYQDFTGKISLDDEYLFKLSQVKAVHPEKFLREDLVSISVSMDNDVARSIDSKEHVLLSKKELENCEYPFVIMLREWRKLTKRDNSFLTPIKEKCVNGWYNQSTSMTAADTARFINPTQTLQGYMKKLDVPYDSNRYFVQFDLAQIEFRVMIGNAVREWDKFIKELPPDHTYDILREIDISYLVDKLNIPWTDYHREGGSVLVGVPPAKMTKEQRSRVKAPHFAVPYGAEAFTVAKDKLLKAQSEAEKKAILEDTEGILMVWRKTMYPLYKYLETKRDIALKPVPDKELPPRLKGHPYGRVRNSLGRWRWYSLDYESVTDYRLSADKKFDLLLEKDYREYKEALAKTTRSVQRSIRRSAGNYPIQSDAREFFAMIMIRLFQYCKSHGLSATGNYETDKIIQSLMIHDENHLQVSKDIHPFKIYQILMENCLLSIKPYPTFYMGIAVCDTWYESKDDKFEAPVQFVLDIIEEYKANPNKFESESWQDSPKNYVLRYISEWISKECDKFIRSWTKDNVFDITEFRRKNDNYFFLIKPGLYTKKFNNNESDISKEELILLAHNTNPDLRVYTGKRYITMNEYEWDFVEPVVHKSEKSTYLFTDESVDDLFDSFDVDDLFDNFDEDDKERKEQEDINTYWLYSEAERTFNSNMELENLSRDIDITEELPEQPQAFTTMACVGNSWVLDIRGMSKKCLTAVNAYLSRYKSATGLPAILLTDTGQLMLKTKYSRNVDLVGLQLVIERV